MSFANLMQRRRALKPYTCCWCGQAIEKNQYYVRQTGNSEGTWFDSKMHPECFDVAAEERREYTLYINERPEESA